VEKPWGQEALPDVFHGPDDKKIGEIWFEPPKGITLQLMTKYLFTSEKLSIQVHPNDRQARRIGMPHGKEECWYILDAKPGARLGLGLAREVSATKLKTAAILGEIEQLIDWKPVSKGEFYYLPAGTIHAIGADVSVVEIQQNIDITYRIYDYGRPRDLHLDEAMAIARLSPYDLKYSQEVPADQSVCLSAGAPFELFQIVGDDDEILAQSKSTEWQVIPLEGSVTVRGKLIKAGECGICPLRSDIDLSKNKKSLIACTIR
ncbi:unnamed protein product, partial [Ectocarpus sp. 8 AP-2014]